MARDSGYAVETGKGGLYIEYRARGIVARLWGPYVTPEEAWAAIPDRTKPPGLEPNLTFFRARGAFENLNMSQITALALDGINHRDVEGTSADAYHNIDELSAAELRGHIYRWLAAQPCGATADAINAAFPDPANRADKQLATMRRAGMITYLVENGERVKRDTRMDRPAYVHVAIPEGDWVPVTPVTVTTNGATSDAAERLERMKATGMSMVPSLRRLRDAVQGRAIGANSLTVELTGIADWLETLFKEGMEYGR